MLLTIAREKIALEKIGIHASALGMAEVGLGSLLHALHIPFAGTVLSLNQIFLITRHLCFESNQQRTIAPFSISVGAALLKCLAPMGKKLTPMLAICMQGLLYNMGIFCFGNTLLGRLTGGLLSSVWSFCQQWLLYLFLLGAPFTAAIEHHAWLKQAFIALVIAKMSVSALIVSCTPLLPRSRFEQYVQVLSKGVQTIEPSRNKSRPLFVQVLADLCKPMFLLSLFITSLFLYFSQGASQLFIWLAIRPLGIGFFCFLLLRLISKKFDQICAPESKN